MDHVALTAPEGSSKKGRRSAGAELQAGFLGVWGLGVRVPHPLKDPKNGTPPPI